MLTREDFLNNLGIIDHEDLIWQQIEDYYIHILLKNDQLEEEITHCKSANLEMKNKLVELGCDEFLFYGEE